MKPVNVLALSAPDTTNAVGVSISASQLVSSSFQSVFGDVTAAGTVTIQASNDIDTSGNLPLDFTPTNWSSVATATVTAGVAPMITIPQMAYRWVRAIYTSTTPGTTTVRITIFAFGV